MSQLKNSLTICTSLLLCVSCATKEDKGIPLLTAILTVDTNPQEALERLAEISFPEFLDNDNYMRYVVTQTQALYMDYQDITRDTLILKAQYYFVENNNTEMATRASFYTAIFWYEKQQENKALEYFLLANYYAQQAGNLPFRAKSLHRIGSIYYDQDALDNAREYYLQALELYTNEANTEVNRLDIKYMLGRTYRELQQYDQALNYFDDGLKASQKLNNELYVARFTHHKGIIFRERKAYSEAKAYFDLALAKSPDTGDSLRIYLNYARLYKATNQPDSTIYYLNLVKNRVAENTYPYTRRAIYQELADYYEKDGNISEMKQYSMLEKKEEQLIQKMKDEANAQTANERFEAYKTIDRTKMRPRLKFRIDYRYSTADSIGYLWAWKASVERAKSTTPRTTNILPTTTR